MDLIAAHPVICRPAVNNSRMEKNYCGNVDADVAAMQQLCGGSDDLLKMKFKVGNVRCAMLWFDGMMSEKMGWELLYTRLSECGAKSKNTAQLLSELSKRELLFRPTFVVDYDTALSHAMSGSAVLLIEDYRGAACVSIPGFPSRAISESYTEENVRASREGFAEPLKVNITLIRRRLKTGRLVVENHKVGSLSNTAAAIVYIRDKVSPQTLAQVRERLKEIDMETVLESGFIEPFFKQRKFSFFSGVGYTERPDSLCAKLAEGRVGIIVDGTPFVLVMPHLFIENFQSFDDYTNKAYYATFIRIIKLVAFAVTIALPGVYVAAAVFAPQLFPTQMLKNIIEAEHKLALPVLAEALFINLVYEIVREAGLRLPRPVGHAVSLLGALIVGDAAVAAGLASSPLVMIAALTTVCSFLVPTIYQPVTFLRFVFIIVGGTLGFAGLVPAALFVLLNITAVDTFGVPYSAPLSPYGSSLLRDELVRCSWRKLSERPFVVDKLPGGKDAER